MKGDVADPETAKRVAGLIKDDFDKKVDILVNNAGITNDKLMMRMGDEDFTKVIDANLNGAFYMMKEFSALMVKKKNGVIINMASVSGLKGNPAQVNYSASKAGVVGMTFPRQRAGKTWHKSKRHRAGIHRNRYDGSADR
ncbi:MAG: SDR family NAD(P)-dependent oxidoreductase [Clostridia bacterium]